MQGGSKSKATLLADFFKTLKSSKQKLIEEIHFK